MKKMTNEDKVALKEFLIGFGIAIGTSVVVLGIIFASGIMHSASNEKFQVIDTYKGCDVVQYLPEYSGRYYFFLHCK